MANPHYSFRRSHWPIETIGKTICENKRTSLADIVNSRQLLTTIEMLHIFQDKHIAFKLNAETEIFLLKKLKNVFLNKYKEHLLVKQFYWSV